MKGIYVVSKLELKLLRRNYWLWILLLLMMTYLYIGYLSFVKKDMDAGQWIQSAGFVGIAVSIVGLMFGSMISRKDYASQYYETSNSMLGIEIRNFGALIAWSIVAVAAMLFAFIEIVALLAIVQSEFLSNWNVIAAYISLYWGITLIGCGYFGYALESLFPAKWWTAILLFLFLFLITPYNEMITKIEWPDSIATILETILFLFNQGEEKMDTLYQEFHGLNISSAILYKKIWFMTFMMIIVIISVMIRQRKYTKKWFLFLLTGTLLAAVSIVFANKAIIASKAVGDLEYRNMTQDYIYYNNLLSPPLYELIDSFNIHSYNIQFQYDASEVNYDVEMKISASMETKQLVFTLYHGLNIDRILINEQLVNYERQGDYLIIQWPIYTSQGIVSMNISGNPGGYGTLAEHSYYLPSDFAWLPIPGVYRLVDTSPYFTYKPVLFPEPVHFSIQVHGGNEVISNLDASEDGTFTGSARGVSLMSGQLLHKVVDGVHIYYPADRLMNVSYFVKNIQEKLNYVANQLGVDTIDFIGEISKIKIVPIFSYENTYVMRYQDDTLYINDKYARSQYQLVSNPQVLFYTFFWNPLYRYESGLNAMIIGELLQFFDSGLIEHSQLKVKVELQQEFLADEDPISKFYVRVYDAYENGYEQRLIEMLRQAYSTIQLNNQNFTIEDWNALLTENLTEE